MLDAHSNNDVIHTTSDVGINQDGTYTSTLVSAVAGAISVPLTAYSIAHSVVYGDEDDKYVTITDTQTTTKVDKDSTSNVDVTARKVKTECDIALSSSSHESLEDVVQGTAATMQNTGVMVPTGANQQTDTETRVHYSVKCATSGESSVSDIAQNVEKNDKADLDTAPDREIADPIAVQGVAPHLEFTEGQLHDIANGRPMRAKSSDQDVDRDEGRTSVNPGKSELQNIAGEVSTNPGEGALEVIADDMAAQTRASAENVNSGEGELKLIAEEMATQDNTAATNVNPGEGELKIVAGDMAAQTRASAENVNPGESELKSVAEEMAAQTRTSAENVNPGEGELKCVAEDMEKVKLEIIAEDMAAQARASAENVNPGEGELEIIAEDMAAQARALAENVNTGEGELNIIADEMAAQARDSDDNVNPGEGELRMVSEEAADRAQATAENVNPGEGELQRIAEDAAERTCIAAEQVNVSEGELLDVAQDAAERARAQAEAVFVEEGELNMDNAANASEPLTASSEDDEQNRIAELQAEKASLEAQMANEGDGMVRSIVNYALQATNLQTADDTEGEENLERIAEVDAEIKKAEQENARERFLRDLAEVQANEATVGEEELESTAGSVTVNQDEKKLFKQDSLSDDQKEITDIAENAASRVAEAVDNETKPPGFVVVPAEAMKVDLNEIDCKIGNPKAKKEGNLAKAHKLIDRIFRDSSEAKMCLDNSIAGAEMMTSLNPSRNGSESNADRETVQVYDKAIVHSNSENTLESLGDDNNNLANDPLSNNNTVAIEPVECQTPEITINISAPPSSLREASNPAAPTEDSAEMNKSFESSSSENVVGKVSSEQPATEKIVIQKQTSLRVIGDLTGATELDMATPAC
ncbi:hypothetical protein SARC_02770 [Sphaeroforma arctica JP610]|uniref:Uncharacterized protein n=1 Tax=Sphaeroforma arctica JP610 TaxID=667725 RepID=A0A0L0G7P3_9EUKA|nr:hypothetical protein SARC_02770 [Sphaeroforma arctica JP610]KNC85015.1 hypothetical protein SARC_02770 [Sphaeroforma arctica JP610]|eukprot:XP_014158917.1 hypothetical protein SARC_02770 [Sphaeroforma arctica JP610]